MPFVIMSISYLLLPITDGSVCKIFTYLIHTYIHTYTHNIRTYIQLMPFVIISVSYLLFTITDGSVRMIVLMHAYNLKFSAMEVRIFFVYVCVYVHVYVYVYVHVYVHV